MSTATAPKSQLGKYPLVRHLASGGMADLWLAQDGDRYVAIKRIRQEQARDQRFVQMFLDEARLAASLHHNHIATVHDIGQVKGEYFYTMEYVHGEDLRKILMLASAREQHLPVDHVMTMLLAVTSALHYAHEHKAQIVHRDVSPANIIVGYDGNIKVLDFGIAKAAHRTKDTQSGVLKGKVAYMSPEQCVGQPVDRRSDIFSLGIVLYELITVRRLFKAANDFLTMSSIIHGDIPWPSTIRPGIPRELEAIAMKALAPDREDRFQTAEEMRVAIERFCTSNHIRVSAATLAEYMRGLFGMKPAPWAGDYDPELDLSIDFDGTLPGVVKIPEAALKRAALPSTTPVQPGALIMKARTKAITGAPPLATATPSQPLPAAPGSQRIAVAVSPSMEERSPFADEEHETDVEVPQPDGPLDVGDQTLMVRPGTLAPRVGRQVAIVFLIAALVAAGAVLLITQLRKDRSVAPPQAARPDIRMPPPMAIDAAEVVAVTPDAVEPVAITPDAAAITPDAEEYEEVEIEVDDPEPAGSAEPGSQVKLRDPAKKKKKRIRRPKSTPPTEPVITDDAAKWDPTTLMPPKEVTP